MNPSKDLNESHATTSYSSSSPSLATRAIRASSASAAHKDSSISSAYLFNRPSIPSSNPPSTTTTSSTSMSTTTTTTTTTTSSASYLSKGNSNSKSYEYTSMKNLNESKQGFWGSLARKAKAFLDDDDPYQQADSPQRNDHQLPNSATKPKYQSPHPSHAIHSKTDSPAPALKKGLNAISSSINYIGNAVEEGLTIVENRTTDIIQETRKHIKKKSGGPASQNEARQQPQISTQMQPQMQADLELQLKASRDVAMAMAAKAKLLLRELKTVKADFAFAKERCAQLEEENKILRENRDRKDNPEDDDLIRLQLETLLAEKARLAHENSVYARENRFLREVVEYHQLTMQDVVYFDEGTEEVAEVYPIKVVTNTHSMSATSSPSSMPTASYLDTSLRVTPDVSPHPVPPPGAIEISQTVSSQSSYTPTRITVDNKSYFNHSD